jgi:hypothetical protein
MVSGMQVVEVGLVQAIVKSRLLLADSLASQIGPALRARLLLALLAIVIMGLMLLVVIRLGAWRAKRLARESRSPSRLGPGNWAARRFLRLERFRSKKRNP